MQNFIVLRRSLNLFLVLDINVHIHRVKFLFPNFAIFIFMRLRFDSRNIILRTKLSCRKLGFKLLGDYDFRSQK